MQFSKPSFARTFLQYELSFSVTSVVVTKNPGIQECISTLAIRTLICGWVSCVLSGLQPGCDDPETYSETDNTVTLQHRFYAHVCLSQVLFRAAMVLTQLRFVRRLRNEAKSVYKEILRRLTLLLHQTEKYGTCYAM